MRVLIFLGITIGILSIIYGYIGWRLITPTFINPMWKRIAWATIVLFMFAPFILFMFRFNRLENAWVDSISWIVYLGLGLFSMLLITLIARDLIWFLLFIIKKVVLLYHSFFDSNPQTVEVLDPIRRRSFLHVINLCIIVLSGALTVYGLFEAHKVPKVKEISVPLSGLYKDLEGFTIAQITDIHVGPTIKRRFVQKVVAQVNRLGADLIVLTGDIADGSLDRLKNDVAPLKDLSAPYGTFFVTGNHEYYSGADAWIKEMERLGFTVLLNENRIIKKGEGVLLLAGIPDDNARRFKGHQSPDVKKSLSGSQPHQVKILLAHQPRSILDAAKWGFDLQLSGHTHGGQFFPWIYIVDRAHPYISGLHLHEKTWIYVSHGIGYWGPPIRLGVPSEITLITLTAEKN